MVWQKPAKNPMQKPAKNPLKIPWDKNLFGSAKNFKDSLTKNLLKN